MLFELPGGNGLSLSDQRYSQVSEDLQQGKNIRLGKRLTLNWEEYRFVPVDQEVIQLLLEL